MEGNGPQQVAEDATSPLNVLLNELMGKKVLVKTRGGPGIRDQILEEGTYPGILVGSDNNFIKLEYNITTFVNGAETNLKQHILINMAYVITVEEHKQKEF